MTRPPSLASDALDSADAPNSAGPSDDMAQRFAVLRAFAETEAEGLPAPRLPGPSAASDAARYSFEPVFASGGLGTIRRAYDHRLERHVAVKELQSYTPGGAAELRLQREALLTARLEHPSIVPIQDRGQHPDGAPFYCMKLVDGQSLDALVRACRSTGERLALVPRVLAVADALAYAHARGIIHRDLKPANILVGRFGETLVIDWGLAKDLRAIGEVDVRATSPRGAAAADDLTRTGECVGTLPYMPLEQAEGEETDARADVYAIGAILYFVLSGRSPYEGKAGASMLAAMHAGPPPDLGSRVAGLPSDLLAIVRKAMAREQAQRYPSAQELAEDLRRFQAGRMVAARSYSPIDVLRHVGRRHRAVVGAASIGLLLTAGIGAYSYAQVLQQRGEAEARGAEAVSAREAEAAARTSAEERRAESEAQAQAARSSAARLLIEAGRQELFVRQRPQQALVLLAEARRLGAEDVGTSTMLAEATRAVDARLATLPGHVGGVAALTHDAAGERLLARSGEGELHLWDLASRTVLARVKATDDVYVDARFVIGADDEFVSLTRKGAVARHAADGRVLAQTTVAPEGSGVPSLRSLGGDQVLIMQGSGMRIVDLASGAVTRGRAPKGAQAEISLPLALRPGAFAVADAWVSSQDYQAHAFRAVRWDLAGGGVTASPTLGRKLAEGFVASADGRRVAFVDAEGDQAVWDFETGELRELGSCGPFAERRGFFETTAAFTSDGEQLVRVVGEDQVARWDVAQGRCARVSAPLGSAAFQLQLTPDGRQLVLLHDDAEVSLLDAQTLALRQRFLAHTRPIGALAIAPDSATMATGGADGEVRVWSLADARMLQRAEIARASTGPEDGRMFVLGRRHDGLMPTTSFADMMVPGNVEPRGTRTLSRIDAEPTPGAAPTITTIDPSTTMAQFGLVEGSRVVGSGAWSGSAALWSSEAPGALGAIDFTAKGLSGKALAVSEDGRSLWVEAREQVGDGAMLQVYRVPEFTLERSLPMPALDQFSLRAGRGIVFASSFQAGGRAKLFDVNTGALVAEFEGAFGNFSPDGDRLIAGTMDGAIRVFDASTGALVKTLREAGSPKLTSLTWGTYAAVYSPDRSVFVTSRSDGTIDVWRSGSLEHVRELRGHLEPARTFDFSPDGKRLLSQRWQPSGGDTMVFLWHLDGDADGRRLDVADVYAATFSPDSRLLATGSSDGVVRLWDGDEGRLAGELRGHSQAIMHLEFTKDGGRLMSAADGDAAIVWQMPVERRALAELDRVIAEEVPFVLVDGQVVRR